MGQQLVNELGHQYGTLTVIQLVKDKNNRTAWLCQCDCGNQKIVRGSDLRAGKITSCGSKCPKKIRYNYIDETGHQYGRLTVIQQFKYRTNTNKILWQCQCSCGNMTIATSQDLRSNKVQSCGCLAKELLSARRKKDIAGQRFGKLIAITENGKNKYNQIEWQCKCDCGTVVYVPTASLISGNTQSCGCCKSQNELMIGDILTKQNIPFVKEYSFMDLVSEHNKRLRFDFAIIANNHLIGLIEYNGEQHYTPIPFFGGEEKLKQQQKYDIQKQAYCVSHNIPLLILNKNNNLESDIINWYQTIYNENIKYGNF